MTPIKKNETKTNNSDKVIRPLIFTEFFHPHMSGVMRYIEGLYSDSAFKPTVITYTSNKEVEITKYKNFKIIRIPANKILGGKFHIPKSGSLQTVLNALQEESFDFVNTHTRFFTINQIGLRVAKKLSLPLYHTEHGAGFVKGHSGLVNFSSKVYDKTFGRKVISSAKKVFCVSHAGVPFVKTLGAKNIVVIPNGISPGFAVYSQNKLLDMKKEYSIQKHVKNFCFMGRLVQAKGVQDVIEALNADEVLYVIGNGDYKSELMRLAKEKNKAVVFLGERDRDFFLNFLTLMDAFINPSYAEGLPTSILEAGIAGCPVIATDVGGTKELVTKNTGWLVRPRHLRAAMTVVSRARVPAMGEHIEKGYVWSVIREKFLNEIL